MIDTAKIPYQWILVGISIGLGAFFAWYVRSLDLLTILVDQNAHLNIARQVVDSMTPGITQLGFWPPLFHIAMLPFVSFEALYRSGLAGTIVGVISLAAASFFLYHILYRFTGTRLISFLGSLLLLLNPYVIYYAVTPMTEVPFLALLFGVAYFLTRWFGQDGLGYLLATAFFIVLASLMRFEGLLLVPIVAVAVAVHLRKLKKKYHEIEAIGILFLFIAILGGVSILAYSWFFGGSPMAFVESTWSAFAQQRDYARPAEGSIAASLQYFLHASYYMIGQPQVLIALVAFAALLFLFPQLEIVSIAVVLLSPLLFDLASMYQGNIVVYVAELPPFNWFYNERYGLYWIGFTIFVPVVVSGLALRNFRREWAERMLLTALFLVPLVALNAAYFSRVAFFDQFLVVQQAAEKNTLQRENQHAAGEFLNKNYDYGKVFITRATHDILTVHAGVPIKNFIFESNYRYFDQTLERPWLFARWVVMLNSKNKNDPYLLNWVRQNEHISQVWGDSEAFRGYYSLAYENKFVRVYKIQETAVRSYAHARGMDVVHIPSLNAGMRTWDPDLVYQNMESGTAAFEPKSGTAEAQAASSPVVRPITLVHVVERGDMLWDLAQRYYGEAGVWKKIADENNIRSPYYIFPGDKLVISLSLAAQ